MMLFRKDNCGFQDLITKTKVMFITKETFLCKRSLLLYKYILMDI